MGPLSSPAIMLSVASRYIRHPLPNQSRVLADQLIWEGTGAAIADYWHAYLVTFVARERVRVASSDFVRIQEYQDAFEQQAPPRVVLLEKPCTGGRVVSGPVHLPALAAGAEQTSP